MSVNCFRNSMRQSIFSRPLEQIPVVRNSLILLYLDLLIVTVLHCNCPELFDPQQST